MTDDEKWDAVKEFYEASARVVSEGRPTQPQVNELFEMMNKLNKTAQDHYRNNPKDLDSFKISRGLEVRQDNLKPIKNWQQIKISE